jgi:hypothetical protein
MFLCKTNNWIVVALIQFMQNHTKIVEQVYAKTSCRATQWRSQDLNLGGAEQVSV